MGNTCSPGCRWWCKWWRLFVLSFFPLDVLDGILDLIESVSEGFPTYSFLVMSGYRTFLVFDSFWQSLLIFDFVLLCRTQWSFCGLSTYVRGSVVSLVTTSLSGFREGLRSLTVALLTNFYIFLLIPMIIFWNVLDSFKLLE